MNHLKKKGSQLFDLYDISAARPYLMGLACLWVTLYHSKYLNLFDSVILNRTRLLGLVTRVEAIGNCAVDLFFFLSGLGLYFSYTRLLEKKAEHPVRIFYQRRFKRILPTILIVTVLTYGLMEVEDTANWLGYVFLYGFLTPTLERGNFWYFSATVVFYLLFPLLHRAIRGKRGLWGAAAIMLGSVALCVFLSHAAETYFFMRGHLFLGRIPAFVLGAYAGKLCLRHQKVPGWVPPLSAAVGILLIILINDRPGWFPSFYKFYAYLLLVLCIALSHGWFFSLFPRRGFLSKTVMLVGSYSMEIYLLYESLYNHEPMLFHSPESTGVVYSLTVFTATLVLAVLLKYTAGQLVKGYEALRTGAGRAKEEPGS